MTRKAKVLLILTLIIQLIIPAYLLSHHYSVTNSALMSATEYRFRINSIDFGYYKDEDNNFVCDEIRFYVEEIDGLRNKKIAVSLNENGLPVLEELKDKKQTDIWFDYDYYKQSRELSADDITFSPNRNMTEIIADIRSEYSWFNRKDENKTYAYVTAKIYKGVFIPTAIYFNGIEVITITNE
ncbi:MAG: hypothetical protein IJE93_02145 [Clostridia bacterium]|nr:hypothetical protein [Clostridia bacterium]